MSQEVRVEFGKPLKLVLRETDVDARVGAQLAANSEGVRVLATDDSIRTLFDALPTAIARRVQSITPEGFRIVEIELSLSVEGKLWGTGISGDVKVKLAPRDNDPKAS